jgi:hypothetical protein
MDRTALRATGRRGGRILAEQMMRGDRDPNAVRGPALIRFGRRFAYVRRFPVCHGQRMLRGMYGRLAAADLVSR